MKKNAKLLALLCAAVLLFSGCSSGTAPESTESTTAATTQSAPDQTQAFETPASETQAPAAERDVTVDFVVVGAGAGAHDDEIYGDIPFGCRSLGLRRRRFKSLGLVRRALGGRCGRGFGTFGGCS